MPKFFHTPFAKNGDKQIIPDIKDPDGYVSYYEGYGNDYARDPSVDARAKPIEREGMNAILNHITMAIRQYQTHGYPDWISAEDNAGSAFAYDVGVIVLHDGKFFISLVSDNIATPGTDVNLWRIHNMGNYLLKENNLSEIVDPDVARSNLKLGTIATQNANAVNITGGTATLSTVKTSEIVQDSGNAIIIHGNINTTGSVGTRGILIRTQEGIQVASIGAYSDGSVILYSDVNQHSFGLDGSGNFTTAGAHINELGVRVYSPNNPPSFASLGATGWHKDNQTGKITQWGVVTRTGYNTVVIFPTAFPNMCFGVLLTLNTSVYNLSDSTFNVRAVNASNSGFTYASAGDSETSSFWYAIGY